MSLSRPIYSLITNTIYLTPIVNERVTGLRYKEQKVEETLGVERCVNKGKKQQQQHIVQM